MKLKNLTEASYHGRSDACVISARDPDSGDHLGTVGPMTKAQANKFIKTMEAFVEKEYAGRVEDYDLPVYEIDYLIEVEALRDEIITHVNHFAR